MMGNTGVDSMSSFNKSGCCCDASCMVVGYNNDGGVKTEGRNGMARLELRKSRVKVAFTDTISQPCSLTLLQADAGPASRATASASQDLQCRLLLSPGARLFQPSYHVASRVLARCTN